jgi:Ca2+-binding RTX toxin-like protein
VLLGGAGDDRLQGGDGNDVLSGDGGTNRMFGDAGDDLFFIGRGDFVDGGVGRDGVTLGAWENTTMTSGVRVSLASDAWQETGSVGRVLLRNIENVFGTQFDDILTGSSEDNLIGGLSGNDRILGEGGNDTLIGGDGSSMTGAGSDRLFGGDGNDRLEVSAGDFADGGADIDTIVFANFNPAGAIGVTFSLDITGEQNTGIAGVLTARNIENVEGTSFNDRIWGDGRPNQINGNTGDDTLTGGGGADTLNGGAGNDVIRGGAGADRINGGGNVDTVYGEGGNDVFVFRLTPARPAETLSIMDFDLSGNDRVELDRTPVLQDFDDVLARMQELNGDTILTIDLAGQIIFRGVGISSFQASDFLIV